MHIDLQQPPAGERYDSTVCVIGGGIAGLTLAMSLARRGIRVHLLEAGGLSPEERSQQLYHTHMAAENHRGSNEGRHRTFGGSSTQWGGQLLPFTADIFSPPPGSPSAGWPIQEPDLAPYYAGVESILGVDPLPFTAGLLPALGHPAAPASPDITLRFAKWAPFGRRNLANTLGAEAIAHPGVTLFTHANVTALEASPSNPARIATARVVNYDGQAFTFTADHFVVCTGTVESSRLLLCSPSVPNPHDQLGRYFHDHVAYHAARLDSPGRERAIELLGPFYIDGTLHSAKLEASPALRGRDRLLAVMAHVVILEPEDSGTAAVRNLLRSLQSGRLKEALQANLLPALRNAGDVARLFFYSRFKKRRAVSKRAELRLNVDVEQAPHPENRIQLSATEHDSLGLPRAIVHWAVGRPEMQTAADFTPIVRRYLEAAGISSLHWTDSVTQGTLPFMLDTYHMMGGLRMGTDPTQSVVDSDLKLHGLDNLHVASCAVFPSGSSSNPTFTLMALTLRLADHLAGQIATQPAA